jgi:hypothetical protein
VRGDPLRVRRCVIGTIARENLVAQDTERVDIGRRRDLLIEELLGAHVFGDAEHLARAGQANRVGPRRRGQRRDPEIG